MKWLIWIPLIMLIGCEKKKVSPTEKLPIDKYAMITGKFTGIAIRYNRSVYNWPPPPPDTFHGAQTFVVYGDSVLNSKTISTSGDTIITMTGKILSKKDTAGYLRLETNAGWCGTKYLYYYPAKDSLFIEVISVCKGVGERNFLGSR